MEKDQVSGLLRPSATTEDFPLTHFLAISIALKPFRILWSDQTRSPALRIPATAYLHNNIFISDLPILLRWKRILLIDSCASSKWTPRSSYLLFGWTDSLVRADSSDPTLNQTVPCSFFSSFSFFRKPDNPAVAGLCRFRPNSWQRLITNKGVPTISLGLYDRLARPPRIWINVYRS